MSQTIKELLHETALKVTELLGEEGLVPTVIRIEANHSKSWGSATTVTHFDIDVDTKAS